MLNSVFSIQSTTINKNILLFSLFVCWTDGVTVVFFPSRFPTNLRDFNKMFFHTNIALAITNRTKKNLFKSVDTFLSCSETNLIVTNGNLAINKSILLFSLLSYWTDGATVTYLTFRFPTFSVHLSNILFHINQG